MKKQSKSGTSLVPLAKLVINKNVRTPSDAGLAELTASVKANGILQPLLVRAKGTKYELVCGHRRLAAARAAGLTEVPVFARELDDAGALAAQIVENLQREDAHALDEADAYRRLQADAKLDVATIAARVGRSVPYVYDRMRLADLVPEAKKLFREGRITPGHAVVLARLKPERQKLALDPIKGGTFEREHVLFTPDQENRLKPGEEEMQKLRTVRELQGWVDEHVKFDLEARDLPQLFPDTHKTLEAAKDDLELIVPITRDYHVHPDAHDGARTYGPMSWKRADGKEKSKGCKASAVGVFVIGPGRGESLRVCVKKGCPIHWPKSKANSKTDANPRAAAASARALKAEHARRDEYARREAARARFTKAIPAIAEELAGALAKQKAPAKGRLAELLIKGVSDYRSSKFANLMKRGKTADDLVRWCAFMVIVRELNDYDAPSAVPKLLKPFGIDVQKIVDRFPIEKPTKAAAGQAPADESSDEGEEE
jgi:ParB/RepB/Spo0J family partition protein